VIYISKCRLVLLFVSCILAIFLVSSPPPSSYRSTVFLYCCILCSHNFDAAERSHGRNDGEMLVES